MGNIKEVKENGRYLAAILLLFLCVFMMTSWSQSSAKNFDSSVSIIGDVEKAVKLSSFDGFKPYKVKDDKAEKDAVKLSDVVFSAQPLYEDYTLLLVGEDGLTAEIDGKNLDDCNLAYSAEHKWELINELHPVSSRIKFLKNIIVVSSDNENGAGFCSKDKETFLTAGQLFLKGYQTQLELEGHSEINSRWVKVYTSHKVIPLNQLVIADKQIAVFTKNGATRYDRPNEKCMVELKDNSLDYIASSGEIIKDIAGILSDPPNFSITEIASDALNILKQGKKVMVIELDGLGWKMLEDARNKDYAPFLATLKAQQALSVYPPVSTAGLAAMVTGVTGDKNGIASRKTKDLKCEDIFQKASALGKSCAYIEESINLINTSLKPVLSPDTNGADTGVFENTLKDISGNNDFIFTHFHSIDDLATTFGPDSQDTMRQIKKVDEMVRKLVAEFDGKVIIVADHGLHTTKYGGSHGRVCYDDMLVPYIILDGGKANG